MAKILVVEDESVAEQCIRAFLEDSEHEIVASVETGLEAVKLAVAKQPDLILMDIYLKGSMDGIATADRIYQCLGIPVIYLSANTKDDIIQRAISTEPFGYLVKPFNQLELRIAINIALRRYRLEKQLEQTEQWLSTTLTSIGDGTIATDRNGCITFMNPVAEMLTGWQQSEALGLAVNQVLNLVHQKTGSAIENPLLKTMREGCRCTLPDHCVLQTKDGHARIIGDSASPIRNSKGEITGGVLVFQDITQRKQAEALLHRREQEFRALVENSPDLIARFDQELCYVYVNPATEQNIGIVASQCIGKTNRELGIATSLADIWDTTLQQVFANGVEQIIEFNAMTVFGERFFQSRVVPEFAPDGQVRSVLSVTRDMTDRKRSEEAIRLQAERDQVLNRVIQTVRNSLDLKTIFDTAVSEIGRVMDMDQVNLVQYRPDQEIWIILASYCRDPSLSRMYLGLEIPDQGNPLTAQLKRTEIVQFNDASELEDEFSQILAKTFPGGWLSVPLQVGEQVWGTIGLVKQQDSYAWQDWQVELACAMGDQLAIAIQQSELYTEVQRLNTDLENQVIDRTALLQQALSFEALLKRITDKVRDSLDENQILQAAVDELGQGLGVARCGAALYSDDLTIARITHEFCQAYRAGFTRQNQPFRIANQVTCDVYHQLFQEQHAQFCLVDEAPMRERAEDNCAIFACPIFDDQGILGDLWLFKPKQEVFSDIEIRLVQQVANQCAIALRQSGLYQSAQAQVTELERLNHLKDDFLSTISHELRTPIANVKMAIQMLDLILFNQEGEGSANLEASTTPPLALPTLERSKRYFNILQTECQREIELIDDLLNLSRLDAETEPLILSTIAPQSWLVHAVEPFVDRIQTHQQRLELDVPVGLPLLVTDLSTLNRILAELMDNACKYTPANGTITVFARSRPEGFQIGVANSGIEISADEIPRIFDRFYRIPKQDPWRYSGTGLGLALVKKLVAHLKATIQVESAAGQTTFIVTFPS
jgi:PAS domain S-box-containing protein